MDDGAVDDREWEDEEGNDGAEDGDGGEDDDEEEPWLDSLLASS